MQIAAGIGVFAAGTLSVWFLLAFSAAGPSPLKSLVKTASVALLALVAFGQGAPILALALGLGALGDFALSRPGDRWLLAGMGAFGAAHLVYILLLIGAGGAMPPLVPSLALLVFSALMAVRLWTRAGALRVPVMGYIVLIAVMGLSALAAVPTLPLAALAAGLFILSDALLSEDLFGPSDRRSTWRPYAIWAAYWTAQLLFLLAFT